MHDFSGANDAPSKSLTNALMAETNTRIGVLPAKRSTTASEIPA